MVWMLANNFQLLKYKFWKPPINFFQELLILVPLTLWCHQVDEQGTGQGLLKCQAPHQLHVCLECHQPTHHYILRFQMLLIPLELEQVSVTSIFMFLL